MLLEGASSHSPVKSRAIDLTSWSIAALVLLPLILLLANHTWIYDAAGYVDPWIYAGYHMHLARLWHDAPYAYYGTRVPWTVLGSIVHHFFAVEASLIILALILFYASTFAIFYAVNSLFRSPLAGVVAASVIGCNFWFLTAIGWNYIDGPAITCSLLSFAAVAGTINSARWLVWSFVWGAATAAMIALMPMLVVWIPIETLVFITLNVYAQRRPLSTIAIGWLGGFTGCAIVMAVANWSLGGSLLFFAPTLQAIPSLAATRNVYYEPLTKWIWNAPWLVGPFVTFFGAILVTCGLAYRRIFARKENVSGQAITLLVFAIAAIVAIAGFTFMNQMQFPVLQYPYDADYLMLFFALLLGGCAATAADSIRPGARAVLTAIVPMVCLAPWVMGSVNLFPAGHEPLLAGGRLAEITWTCVGAALLVAVVFLRNWFVLLLTVAFFSLLNVACVGEYVSGSIPPNHVARDESLMVFDISGFIDGEIPRDRPLNIWWSAADPEVHLFSSLGSMYIKPYVTPTPHLAPDQQLVILYSRPAYFSEIAAWVKKQHLATRTEAEEHFARGSDRVTVRIISLRRGADAGPAVAPPNAPRAIRQ